MTKRKDEDELVVLHGQERELADLQRKLGELRDDDEMHGLRAHADALLGATPKPDSGAPRTVEIAEVDWDALAKRHRTALLAEGVHTTQLRLEQLMTTAERAAFEHDWQRLVEDTETRLDDEQLGKLAGACKKSVLDAVVRPFGLGAIVSRLDKRGGDVLTHHNAAVARDEDALDLANPRKLRDYSERMDAEYDRRGYDEGFRDRRKAMFQTGEPIQDAYTGKDLPRDGRMNLDHVVSAKEIHQDSGANFFLTEDEKRAFALSDDNIVPTDKRLNQSKNDNELEHWLNKERHDGASNAEHFDVDRDRARNVDARARKALLDRKAAAATDYYIDEQLKAGLLEAGKMGIQQALGLLLAEAAVALFDEIVDVYNNGMVDGRPDANFLGVVAERLRRIWERVAARWKDALGVLVEGGISGFVSSLITTVINMVVTTGRRVVRLIREGVFSLWRALRMLASPPANMSPARAAHEASKLVASGVAIGAGVMAEEAVHKAIVTVPPLVPFADAIAAVITGIGSGLVSVMLVYVIDRVDMFGAQKLARQDATLATLEEHASVELTLLQEAFAQYAPST